MVMSGQFRTLAMFQKSFLSMALLLQPHVFLWLRRIRGITRIRWIRATTGDNTGQNNKYLGLVFIRGQLGFSDFFCNLDVFLEFTVVLEI